MSYNIVKVILLTKHCLDFLSTSTYICYACSIDTVYPFGIIKKKKKLLMLKLEPAHSDSLAMLMLPQEGQGLAFFLSQVGLGQGKVDRGDKRTDLVLRYHNSFFFFFAIILALSELNFIFRI